MLPSHVMASRQLPGNVFELSTHFSQCKFTAMVMATQISAEGKERGRPAVEVERKLAWSSPFHNAPGLPPLSPDHIGSLSKAFPSSCLI